MKRTAQRQKGVALASLSKKSGATFTVIASKELEIQANAELASFGCSCCKTKFSALAGTKPFCVTCGSEEVDEQVVGEDLPPEQLEDGDDTHAITCSHCDSHNIMSSKATAALKGAMHCVTCGEGIDYNEPDADEEIVIEDEPLASLDDADDIQEVEVVDDEPVIGSDEGEEITDASDSEDDIGGDSLGEEDAPTYTVDATGEGIDLDLIDTVDPEGDEELELSTTMLDDVLVAFVNNVSVATLTREQAGANSAVYNKSAFTEALCVAANKVGVKAALQDFGFHLTSAKFPLSSVVSAKVQEQLVQERNTVEAHLTDLKADYTQCLQIATAGINRNFFRDVKNPLVAGLVAELEAVGVRGASALVKRVMANQADPYMNAVLSKADELMGKGVDVRNQLAETLEDVNPLEVDEDEVEDTVEARLSSPQINVKPKLAYAQTASVDDSPIQQLKALAGGKLF